MKIKALRNGPYVCEEPITVEMADGRTIETSHLCRCGKSGNKPQCDGTHAKEHIVLDTPEEKIGDYA